MKRRTKKLLAALSVTFAAVGAIAINIATGGEAVAWNDRAWLLVIIALVGSAYVTYRLTFPAAGGVSATTSEAASNLSRILQTQWRNEDDFQYIRHPYPLPLSWTTAPDDIVDQWVNIRGAGPGEDAGPIPLTGSLPQILEVFNRLPFGRMIILGAGGSGKSVLSRQLGLDMIAERTAEGRVPVIFRLRSWNPRQMSYQDWLALQLGQEHPSLLALTPSGSTLATAMIVEDRILPILDGFDEVAEGLRHEVLLMLSEASGPLVLTSRTAEYMAQARNHPIAKAAAIELLPLDLSAVAEYLRRTAGERQGRQVGTKVAWAQVFSALEKKSYAARLTILRRVFSTPLMVSLARSVYQDPDTSDPTELLNRRRFPGQIQIEAGLLRGYLPAVYRTTRSEGQKTTWTERREGAAEKYLRTIAVDLERRGESVIVWWELPGMLGHRVRASIIGGLAGAGVVVAILMVGWSELGTTFSVAAAVAVSIAAALCFGGASLGVRPVSMRMVPRADWRMLSAILGVSGLIWIAIWLMSPADRGFNASIIHFAAAGIVRTIGTGVSDAMHAAIDWMPVYYTSWGTIGVAVGLSAWLTGHVSRTAKTLRSMIYLCIGALVTGGSTFVVGVVLLVDEGGNDAALRDGGRVFVIVLGSALTAFLAARAVDRRWSSRRGKDYFIERALASFGYGMLVSLLFSLVFGLLGIVSQRQQQANMPAPESDSVPSAQQVAFAGLPKLVQYLYEVSSAVLAGIDFGLPIGFAVTLGAGIAFSLVGAFTAPLDVKAVPSAEYLLGRDRISTVVLLVAGGTFAGLLSIEIDSAASRFVVGFVISAIFVMSTTAWGRWIIFVRGWMTLTGRMPRATMAFLEDAHQRGVLRQSGGGYQFRHSAIQRHLANQRTATPRPDAGRR